MSMFKKTTAAREKVKIMVGLAGPSGAGKTYSALQMAYGITGDWTKVTVVDTENKSALYYAGERTGLWEHVDFPPTVDRGYHPENWVKMLDFVESDPKTEVVILDSITHEWEGAGGCLELVDELGKAARGNAFSGGWKIVTPLHRAFIDRMRHGRLHVIATMRSKQDYVVETNDKGKAIPKKVGMKTIQREGTDYEFGIVFDVEMNHYATASKDRTGLFAPRAPFKINVETGKELLAWANSGIDAPKVDKPGTYTGAEDQQKIVRAKLAQQKVPEDLWPEIDQRLRGRPMAELKMAYEEAKNTAMVFR